MYCVRVRHSEDIPRGQPEQFEDFDLAVSFLVDEIENNAMWDLEALGRDLPESGREDLIEAWSCVMLDLRDSPAGADVCLTGPDDYVYTISKE